MLNTCAPAGVTWYDKSNEIKVNFYWYLLAILLGWFLLFFLKIPLAAYPNVTKNCNSRGIRQFKGKNSGNFTGFVQKQLKQVKCPSVRTMPEKLFSHGKLHTWTWRSYSTYPRSNPSFGRRFHSSSWCKSNSTVAAHTCKLKTRHHALLWNGAFMYKRLKKWEQRFPTRISRLGLALWLERMLGMEHLDEGHLQARTDVELLDILRRSEHRRPWQNKIDFIFNTS